MDLINNVAFRIQKEAEQGLFRVILNEQSLDRIGVVRIDPPDEKDVSRGGRRRLATPKRPRKKAAAALIGRLLWKDRADIDALSEGEEIQFVEVEQDNFDLSESAQKLYERRKAVMEPLLDPEVVREQVLIHGNMSGLIRLAMNRGGSKSFVHKNLSLLCQYGFTAESLRPRLHECGNPEKPRPCDPGGRKKPGRKTDKQRIARNFDGTELPPEQPGMSSQWRAWILAADKLISTPKPPMPERVTMVIDSHFIERVRIEDGSVVPVDPKIGTVPNRRQIERVLREDIPRLQRLLESTTKGHFNRSMRRLLAKNWKGAAGPGHTWAIDSTIGDIYLRSSINRAWIIGRPIVYIIVDVWSTAIVGFYVCLTGPCWDTAKVSLFSASAPPELLGELWGYEPTLSLDPLPTLPSVLLCDRGEYLSRGARQTGAKLIPCLSYTPPYRPDLKGLVEVLHRIAKDAQFYFVPGAIDQRRAEFELRRFNPNDAVLTVRDYVAYLHTIFSEYNLAADRRHRVDAHMHAAGVFPSPAGLWRWGHQVGIGVRRHVPISQLITDLLPSGDARVSGAGVRFAGREYCSEIADEQNWTALARNFGGWDIRASHFPGSISRIWTPNPTQAGLLDFTLSDYTSASSDCTFDEVVDAFMVGSSKNAEVEHERLLKALKAKREAEAIIERAKRLTAEAVARDKGPKPTMTEARKFETTPASNLEPTEEAVARANDEAKAAHQEMMEAIIAAATASGGRGDE